MSLIAVRPTSLNNIAHRGQPELIAKFESAYEGWSERGSVKWSHALANESSSRLLHRLDFKGLHSPLSRIN